MIIKNNLIFALNFNEFELAILGALILIVFIALIAFRVNYRTQMRVSLYMDSETQIYNKKGLEVFLKRKRRKFSNPTLLEVYIENLHILYDDYVAKEKLMNSIANEMLRQLGSKETLARVDFDKFVLVLNGKDKIKTKELCKTIEHQLDNLELDDYGKYDFTLRFAVYNETLTKKPKDDLVLVNATLFYSVVREGNIYYYCKEVYDKVQKIKRMNEQKYVDLVEQRIIPYIQPKVDLRSGRVIGGEILTRWLDSSQNQMYSPGEFIPLFESNGFVKEVDFAMFKHACALAQTLIRKGFFDIIISVNVSKVNLLSKDFATKLRTIITEYQISPKNIELEITETIVMSSNQLVANSIMDLKYMGFKVSMDDFGKEYSSLGILSSNSFDTVKIDGVFFKDKLSVEKSRNIVGNILNMLGQLNYSIVCECIEDKQTIDAIAAIRRDVIIQGYYISKPMPVNQFEAFAETIFDFSYLDALEVEEVEDDDNSGIEIIEDIVEPVKMASTLPNNNNINIELVSDNKKQENDEIKDLRRKIDEMQNIITQQQKQAYESELKHMRDQMEMMRTVQQPQVIQQPQMIQQPQSSTKDVEIEILKREIELLRMQQNNNNNNNNQQQAPQFVQPPIYAYAPPYMQPQPQPQPQQNINVDELIKKLSESTESKFKEVYEKANQEASSLKEKLAQEKKEKEELENLLREINENLKNRNVVVEDDDEEEEEEEEEEEVQDNSSEKSKYTLEELEAIISSFQKKYKEDWNAKAKEELKDGYYEVVSGLKYYKDRVKLSFKDKLKKAPQEVKDLYNNLKVFIMQYGGVENKTLNSCDAFYVNRKQFIKLSVTKTKLRVFLALDPDSYDNKQFPHRDYSHKKAHAKTPFLMMVKSNLSVKRVQYLINELLTENNCVKMDD